ncbi:MAG TPA: ATP-binding protein [Terriglobales bacterium]|jgi:PAS domain S-box-containing protein|nr:ATP-binding protein [Terriglobales bacterium]
MTHEPVNILMVDDQPGKLLSYEAILNLLGENLLKANSGREALEILLKTDVAVVLMDVSMPDIDGFQLADMIREHPRFQKTAIIFISAVHLSDLDRLKGYERGAVDYLSVPVVPELLRAKVTIFAELYRKTQELERLNHELERRVAERTEELRESESQFRSLANSIPQLAWMAYPDGHVYWFNQRWYDYTGTTLDELKGLESISQVHPDFMETVSRKFQHSMATGEAWEDTFPLRGKDGSHRWFLSRALPIHDVNGNIVRWFGTNTDITDRKQAEEALVKSERFAAMGRLAGIIAHEINNPLEAITNAFYLLRDHPSLDQEARYFSKLAEEELRRVAHITKQTLSFYRESQQPVAVSLADVLDNVLELQSRRLQVNGIALDKNINTNGVIHGYPGELKQVFLNIIGNAVQAMPNGGRLRIDLRDSWGRSNGDYGVRVSVHDTGVGIEPEHAKKIFEPFFSTKDAKGTGLGLWISKGIIQKYGGTIRFRSMRRGERRATCFSVFIPTAISAAPKDGSQVLVA